jgi:hypothetical protein
MSKREEIQNKNHIINVAKIGYKNISKKNNQAGWQGPIL